MTDVGQVLAALSAAGAEFMIIGGVAGRPKDIEAIAELEALLEEQKKD